MDKIIQTLRLRQALHILQAEHMLESLKTLPQSSPLRDEILREIDQQTDLALLCDYQVSKLQGLATQYNLALAEALRRETGKGSMSGFCWVATTADNVH